MTRSQANRIEEIIRTQDVRDPRATLDVIAAIVGETPSIKPEQSNAFEKLMAAMMEEPDDEVPHLVPEDVEKEYGNPVGVIRIYNAKPRPGKLGVAVAFDSCSEHLEPRHFQAVQEMMIAFSNERAEEE